MAQSESPTPHGVLAGGNWIVDHVNMIDAWPPQDSLAMITDCFRGNGGCTYNLLKDLVRLECGFPLAAVGLIGDDADGEWILNDCRECGIDSRSISKTPKAATSFCQVMSVKTSGRRTFFSHAGANALLAEKDFDLIGSKARIFHLGYLTLLDSLDALDANGRTGASRLFEQAGKIGMLTVADLVSKPEGDFSAVINPSLPWLDYLFLNEFEAARLLGIALQEIEKGVSVAWLAESAQQILKRGVRCAVIIHTPAGAICACREGGVFLQGPVRVPQEAIRGTAGAGDAFAAGCVLGIHEGWDYQAWLELGVCAAASSLGDATCSGAIKPWRECLREGRSRGFADFEISKL